MFEKYARLEDRAERLEIFNILKLNLCACLRLVEFLVLVILISGPAWFLGSTLTETIGRLPGAALALGLMLGLVALARLPLLLVLSRLAADFGLDPRPAAHRFKDILAPVRRRGLAAWLISFILYLGLSYLNLWIWTLASLILGIGLMILDAYFPGWLRPERIRPLRPDDLEPALLERLDHWTSKTGLPSRSLAVSTSFSPTLEPPRLEGLGRTTRLIIPEKALAAFTPRELSVMVVAAAVSSLVKAPFKFLLLRLCALAVAIPLASIFISTLGLSLWGYPLYISPALLVLVWTAAWIGYGVAEFALRLTRRGMEAQLAAVAVMVTKDEEALPAALATLADKNLEEEAPPAWREIFRHRYSRQAFLKRAKYHQHMAKFTDE